MQLTPLSSTLALHVAADAAKASLDLITFAISPIVWQSSSRYALLAILGYTSLLFSSKSFFAEQLFKKISKKSGPKRKASPFVHKSENEKQFYQVEFD